MTTNTFDSPSRLLMVSWEMCWRQAREIDGWALRDISGVPHGDCGKWNLTTSKWVTFKVPFPSTTRGIKHAVGLGKWSLFVVVALFVCLVLKRTIVLLNSPVFLFFSYFSCKIVCWTECMHSYKPDLNFINHQSFNLGLTSQFLLSVGKSSTKICYQTLWRWANAQNNLIIFLPRRLFDPYQYVWY